MSTTWTLVADTAQEYIKEAAVIPLAQNVPMHEVADVWRLPKVGDVLRIPRAGEMGLAETLSKDTLWDITNTSTGDADMSFAYSEHTIAEKGLFCNILKWAEFTSALDLAKLMGNRLINSAARTMNIDAYTALVEQAGLQHVTVGGLASSPIRELTNCTVGAAPTTTTVVLAEAVQIDDFWNLGQITFTTGRCAGLSRQITDFVASTDTVTFDALAVAPQVGDKANLMCLGNAVSSGALDLAATDVMTLTELYRAHERCRRYGAGAAGMGASNMDVAGIYRDRSGQIPQGIAFMPTEVAHTLRVSTMTATTSPYFQTPEGFQRAVGGNVSKIGGLLIAEVNHFLQATVTTQALAVGAGIGYPTVILYDHAWGCTVLKDNPGNKQGLDITVKMPGPKDPAIMWKSLKARGEMSIINAYFPLNSLWGAVLWSGVSV